MRLLADGAGDLHFGGIDDGRALPAFLRREPLLRITAGIVAHRDHPLQSARPTLDDLVRHPWLECYASARASPAGRGASLASILERLHERTGERAGPVLRAGAADLRLLAEGPWLSWGVPVAFLAPVHLFEDIARDIALECPRLTASPPGRYAGPQAGRSARRWRGGGAHLREARTLRRPRVAERPAQRSACGGSGAVRRACRLSLPGRRYGCGLARKG